MDAPATKSFSRRVSFNEETILPPKERRCDYSASDMEKRASAGRGCRFCGRMCTPCYFCRFACGLCFLFVVIILFTGLIYSLLFRWEMPEVRIQRIHVDLVAANSTADLTVLLNATNGGKRTQLMYSKLIASVEASGIRFGVARLPEFQQAPRNSRAVEVAVVMEDSAAAGRDLWSKSEAHALAVDVYVKGRIDAIHRGNKMQGFMFQIECRNVKQSEIDAGRQFRCKNQLYGSNHGKNDVSKTPAFECYVGTQVDPSCL
ncbi:uncharacterized protein LOC125202433 [Salvia hispanica]|uniref:uncharacterized protein LOC125202433 n=1 Tax=Salvia hispanica TaxID=49212 RepID=UPI002009AFDC|nr:uncharacterized protein LOC125202433 [Salvia hispanica]